jgi:hypothetical protein
MVLNTVTKVVKARAGYDLNSANSSANLFANGQSGLSGWSWRRAIPITAGSGVPTDSYQLSLTVHYGAGTDSGTNIYLNALCNTDFSDIRFTKSDGSTLLDYWLKSKTDGDNAVFWIEFIGNLNSAASIYINFGNASASSTSSEANTFVSVISNVAGAWNFEETANATTADSSGNGNDGTATGTTIVDGKFAGKKARNFASATADHVALASDVAALKITDKLSLVCYVKTTTKAKMFCIGKSSAYLLAQSGPSATGYVYSYQYGDSTYRAGGTVDITDGAWHCVASTHYPAGGADNHVVYVDGTAYPYTTAGTAIANSTEIFWIGGRSVSNSAWDGVIAYPIVVHDIITAAQMTSITNNYPDTTLDAGKILVRKYATTTQPAFSTPTGLETRSNLNIAQKINLITTIASNVVAVATCQMGQDEVAVVVYEA